MTVIRCEEVKAELTAYIERKTGWGTSKIDKLDIEISNDAIAAAAVEGYKHFVKILLISQGVALERHYQYIQTRHVEDAALHLANSTIPLQPESPASP